MRKIEAVAAFGMWTMLVLAAEQAGATQTSWGNQIWSESEWMTEGKSEEGNEREDLDGTEYDSEKENKWGDENEIYPETEEVTEKITEKETEGETEKRQIILSEIRVTEQQRYYDGTDRVGVEAQVTGLPDGMQLHIEGKAQQADAGTWPVEVICSLEGMDSEAYEILKETTEEPMEIQILPRPLSLTISNARKSYYTETTLDNLIFEEKEPIKVTGFLEKDCPEGEPPEGFRYPELECDTTVLQKDSPMYEKGKPILYRQAVTVKKNSDGSITGDPTNNYTFYKEEKDNIIGGDVILSAAPITGTLDYTIQAADASAMWMDPSGILWVRAGAQIEIDPSRNSGFTDGEVITDIRGDGTAEFVLTRRNGKGEIIAESQIRSISWKMDGEAPQSGWMINGKKTSPDTVTYLNRDSQLSVTGLTEYGSGIRSVELYAAYGEERTMDGEALYRSKKGGWKCFESLFLNREGSCCVWIRTEDMVGNVRYQCTGEIVTDQTAPEIYFENITAGSANSGEVKPVCVVRDSCLKKDSLKMTLTGYQNGEQQVTWSAAGTEADEIRLQMENLPEKREWDDVYTLKAEAEDQAGNHSSREIRFSVNRFGSVYYLGEETQKQMEQFYVSSPENIQIYEVNVDYLTESGILLGHEGETRQLKRGKDYTVLKQGNDKTWKEYCYTISSDCFEEEGLYYLICASEDRAWNTGDNRMEKEKIEFAVDKSAPFILLTGVEEDGIYRNKEKTVTLECGDNLALQRVSVWLNGKEILQNAEEEQEIVLKQSEDWQTIRVVAADKAGNIRDTGEMSFWLGEQEQIPEKKLEKEEAEQNLEDYTDDQTQGNSGKRKKESESSGKRSKNTENKTGKNWAIVPGIAVFTALLAILFLRKREK